MKPADTWTKCLESHGDYIYKLFVCNKCKKDGTKILKIIS